MKISSILYFVFLIALASDPFLVTFQALFFKSDISEIGFSFLQIARGILLALLLYLILISRYKWFRDAKTVHPFLILVGYAFILAPFSPFPLEGYVWAFRVFYLCTIFIAAMILTTHGKLTDHSVWKIASFILTAYFVSQILAVLMGMGGLEKYHTEFGSAGFGVRVGVLSWTICSLVPVFFYLDDGEERM